MGEVLQMTVRKRGDPQIENGYLKVANELAEAMYQHNFSATESRIIWYIIRRTFGYNKTWARITVKEWEEATRLKSTHIYRTLRRLQDRNIVTWDGHKKKRRIRIQKHYKKWKDVTYPGRKDRFRSQDVTREGHTLPIISERQLKDREGPSQKCSYCQQEFQPREPWMKKCDECFKNPPQRVQPKEFYPEPCTKCEWKPYSGYEHMKDGLCLDCRQEE
jgi:phage replication O-like protein O